MTRTKLFLPFLLAFVSSLSAERLPGRYIVELTGEPVADHVARLPLRSRMQSAAARSHRTLIDGEQRRMRARVEQRRARVLDSATNVANALFVEADQAAAEELAAMPGVKRVSPVRMFHRVLDQAVSVHKVTEAWNRIGLDRAGEGIRIAIIDTGIQTNHAAFQDPTLKAPQGYPKATSETDLASTSGKVIVARSYVGLLARRDPDNSARDRVGHGTALAMIAAGVRNAGARATISGIAPRAYLGNYKVFGSPGVNDGATEDAIIKAMDDAVADGMDIINLSLGSDIPTRLELDPTVDAVERATKAGVIVVAAAGNNGPDFTTISSPATAPTAIAVGASTNGRKFASSVEIPGANFLLAIAADNAANAVPVTAELADVASIGKDGLACEELPSGSLANRIALILRGTCTFEVKLNNARNAGAVGAVVYAAEAAPAAIAMATGTATLPAEMVNHTDGLALKQAAGTVITLRFTVSAVPQPAGRMSDFSASGPGVDTAIKPEILAVGSDVYTATQTLDSLGDMFSSNGFIVVDGTSFSAPLVAGAAALIKAARPGLSVHEYRSLIVNTASEALGESGGLSSVQQTGAGLLDADAALRSTAAVYPVTVNLGAGAPELHQIHSLFLTNLGARAEVFEISFESRAGQPIGTAASTSVSIGQGGAAEVPVNWSGTALAPGAHEGFVIVRGTASGSLLRIPYWYDVISDKAAHILVLDSINGARRGTTQRDAILFRVTDSAGLPIVNVPAEVTVTAGDTTVRNVAAYDDEVPGLFGVNLDMGLTPGPNEIQIKAGDVLRKITITVQ